MLKTQIFCINNHLLDESCRTCRVATSTQLYTDLQCLYSPLLVESVSYTHLFNPSEVYRQITPCFKLVDHFEYSLVAYSDKILSSTFFCYLLSFNLSKMFKKFFLSSSNVFWYILGVELIQSFFFFSFKSLATF